MGGSSCCSDLELEGVAGGGDGISTGVVETALGNGCGVWDVCWVVAAADTAVTGSADCPPTGLAADWGGRVGIVA